MKKRPEKSGRRPCVSLRYVNVVDGGIHYLFYCWRKAMDKMCIKFEKKYNLFIFHKDRLDSHVDNHV
ncbi:hypothetical protein NM96_11330 [Neisseria mucosa]|uniref:hypothetical protein n=1 Tax=Neisseria mucosa TaxID=488 RepID=UPI000D155FA7|nr:hypothetical protein NM96_11330 [Neisseria mucosa]